MRPYRAFYNGMTYDLAAESSYAAQKLAAEHFRAKKAWQVTVVLLDVEFNPVSL